MKPFLASLALGIVLVSGAHAQSSNQKNLLPGERTVVRVQQMDVLIQILPLNLKQGQIDKILTALEKGRQKEREIRTLEDKDLAVLDGRLEKALKDAYEKGAYPPRELQNDVVKMLRAVNIRRQVAASEIVDQVWADTKDVFEPGQKTVMEKSLNASFLEPGLDVEKMNAEAKIKFFIKKVFLDPTTYDSLKELRKVAPTADPKGNPGTGDGG